MIKSFIKKIVPTKLIFTFVHIKKTLTPGGFASSHFSECGEDILINKYLFPKKKQGFYVDIGAFHPKFLSNTYQLHKRGWSGINVDANKESIRYFKNSRPKDINICTGIGASSEKKVFHVMENAAASTFDQEIKDVKKEHMGVITSAEIQCISLEELFKQYLPKDQEIDVLDVDVEHLDLKVLKSNDWNKFSPNVVLVEDREFRTKLSQSRIYKYLEEQGYHFYAYAHITLIMCHERHVSQVKKY